MSPSFEEALRGSYTAAAIRRNARLALGAGIFFVMGILFFGALLVHGGFILWTATAFVSSCLIAFWAIRGFLRSRDPLSSPLVQTILNHPEQIVWIYVLDQQAAGSSVQRTVHVHCAPRRVFVLYSPDPDAVVAELASWCPHAHIGWSDQVEAAWSKACSSLERAA